MRYVDIDPDFLCSSYFVPRNNAIKHLSRIIDDTENNAKVYTDGEGNYCLKWQQTDGPISPYYLISENHPLFGLAAFQIVKDQIETSSTHVEVLDSLHKFIRSTLKSIPFVERVRL